MIRWFECILWFLKLCEQLVGFNVIYGFSNTVSRGLQYILWFLKYFEQRVSMYFMVSQILQAEGFNVWYGFSNTVKQ